MMRAYRWGLERLTALEHRARVIAVDVLLWTAARLIRLRSRIGTAIDRLEASALAIEPATRHVDDELAGLIDLTRRRKP